MTIALPFLPARPVAHASARDRRVGDARRWPRCVALAGVSGATPPVGDLGAVAVDGAPRGPAAPPPLTDPRSSRPNDAIAINAQIPLAASPNPAAPALSRSARRRGDRARALECLTSAIYYEAGQESRRRPARGRAGRPQPGPPSRPFRRASAASSTRARRGDRLPVHLHLRRLAGPRADAPTAGTARARSPSGARRRGLRAGRLGDPLSRQLRRALLGLEPGQDRRRRRPSLLSLGGRLGPSGRVRPSAIRATRPTRGALRLAALSCRSRYCRAQCAAATARRYARQARRRRSQAAEAARVRVRFNPQAREAVEAVKVVALCRALRGLATICAGRSTARRAEGDESEPLGQGDRAGR